MTTGRDYTRPDESVDPADAVRANNELWDEWTRIHEASAFYDLEGFRTGERGPEDGRPLRGVGRALSDSDHGGNALRRGAVC